MKNLSGCEPVGGNEDSPGNETAPSTLG